MWRVTFCFSDCTRWGHQQAPECGAHDRAAAVKVPGLAGRFTLRAEHAVGWGGSGSGLGWRPGDKSFHQKKKYYHLFPFFPRKYCFKLNIRSNLTCDPSILKAYSAHTFYWLLTRQMCKINEQSIWPSGMPSLILICLLTCFRSRREKGKCSKPRMWKKISAPDSWTSRPSWRPSLSSWKTGGPSWRKPKKRPK